MNRNTFIIALISSVMLMTVGIFILGKSATASQSQELFNTQQPSMDTWNISPMKQEYQLGEEITVSVQGNEATRSIGMYVMKRSTPSLPNRQPCFEDITCYDSDNITSYDQTIPLEDDTWFLLGRCDNASCTHTIRISEEGIYYFATNFHTDTQWWSIHDIGCAWEGWLARDPDGENESQHLWWITDENNETYNCTNHAFPPGPGISMKESQPIKNTTKYKYMNKSDNTWKKKLILIFTKEE